MIDKKEALQTIDTIAHEISISVLQLDHTIDRIESDNDLKLLNQSEKAYLGLIHNSLNGFLDSIKRELKHGKF